MSNLNIHRAYSETADIETSSDDYAGRFRGQIGEWFLEIQEKATIEKLAVLKPATILDVGGGHGQLTSALIDHDYRLTVLGSAEVCKARIQQFIDDQKCSFQVGNLLNIPFGDDQFDAVISYRLLPHVNRWQEFIMELTRVARRAVIVDYPEYRSFNAFSPLFFEMKKEIEGNTRPYRIFREEEIFQVFKSQGFICNSKFREFFLPMVVHRKMNSLTVSRSLEAMFRILGFTRLFGSPVILEFIPENSS